MPLCLARGVRAAVVICSGLPSLLPAQSSAGVEAERRAWSDWLANAPTSPYVAVLQQPVGRGLTVGPASADVPLDGAPAQRIVPAAPLRLVRGDDTTALAPGRPVRLGRFLIVAGGIAGRPVVTVFDSSLTRSRPVWFDYDPALVFIGPLLRDPQPRDERLLAPDGVEVMAQAIGSVQVPFGDSAIRLAVKRIPDPVSGEAQLEIFFRDATNGQTTYPAGRFVALVPTADGRYRLDLNRARNPFCAYSVAYACPAPWRGNVLPGEVRAGEQYARHE